jgi:hypothetical protein
VVIPRIAVVKPQESGPAAEAPSTTSGAQAAQAQLTAAPAAFPLVIAVMAVRKAPPEDTYKGVVALAELGRFSCSEWVVRDRIELSTFRFSGGRSYRLSYLTSAR